MMETRIIFVVLLCVASSIAQTTRSTSGSSLLYDQTPGIAWQTSGTGTCNNASQSAFLTSSLPKGSTSSILSITGWTYNFPVSLSYAAVYQIEVNITYTQNNNQTQFDFINLLFPCGTQLMAGSSYSTTEDAYTQTQAFTLDVVGSFNLSQVTGSTLKLRRTNNGTASGSYNIHCITITFFYNTASSGSVFPCSPSVTPSRTPSTSVSSSVTPSISVSPSVTPSPVSPSVTPSISVSSSITPSISVSPSVTPSISVSPSVTPSISVSSSVTPSISVSSSVTPSISVSSSVTASVTPSITATASASVTPSATRTPSTSVSSSVTPVSPSITPVPPSKSSSKNGTVIGAAVGAVVGGVALVGLVAFLVVRKQRSSKPGEDRNSLELSSGPSSSGYAPYSTNNDTKPLNKKGTIRNELYIDDVKLKGLLGRGKFGEVYEGTWHGSTPVACKRLKQEDQTEFENEIRLLTMLNHPNVVRCLGIWINPSQEMYMVLELLRLGSLADFLRKKESQAKLTVADLIEMCANIASGMIYLEHQNIVHRDLGARNLLVTETDGKYLVKVSDFGLSRQVDDSDAVYSSKEGVFPIKWSPPEVINFRKFTSKSDVWSLGVTMWEVFEFGKMPYPSMTNQQCMEEVMKGYRLPQPQNCPDRVFACMKSCWQEDPDLRPNFKAIHETLLNILEDMHVKKNMPEENFDLNNNSSPRNSLYNTASSFHNRNSEPGGEIYNSRLSENQEAIKVSENVLITN